MPQWTAQSPKAMTGLGSGALERVLQRPLHIHGDDTGNDKGIVVARGLKFVSMKDVPTCIMNQIEASNVADLQLFVLGHDNKMGNQRHHLPDGSRRRIPCRPEALESWTAEICYRAPGPPGRCPRKDSGRRRPRLQGRPAKSRARKTPPEGRAGRRTSRKGRRDRGRQPLRREEASDAQHDAARTRKACRSFGRGILDSRASGENKAGARCRAWSHANNARKAAINQD